MTDLRPVERKDGVDRLSKSLDEERLENSMYIGRGHQSNRAGGDPTIFKVVVVDRAPVA